MEHFYVICEDINRRQFLPYDVIPYLVSEYKKAKEKPQTFEEFKDFVQHEARCQWWGRCEYEIIITEWPPAKNATEDKWDVYRQLMLNLDIVVNLLIKSVK